MTSLALALRSLRAAETHLTDAQTDAVSDETARLARDAWHQIYRIGIALTEADRREKAAKARELRGVTP